MCRWDVGHFANVSAGSVHLHHYLWGILLVVIVAFLGFVERSPTWRTAMGLAFGIGLALIVDELALLIDLKDVYWRGAPPSGRPAVRPSRHPPSRRPAARRPATRRPATRRPCRPSPR